MTDTPREKVLRYQPVTLENLDSGGLSEEFQTALQRVVEMFAEPARFVVKNDQIRARIVAEVELTRDVRTGAMDASYKVSVKAPASRAFESSLYMEEGGQLLVEVAEQLELGAEPETSVTQLRPAAEEETE